jgi:hypothetical protein
MNLEPNKFVPFRRLEPDAARTDRPALGRADAGDSTAEIRRKSNNIVDECCAVPWARRAAAQPFAWHDLGSEQPLAAVRIRLGKWLTARSDVHSLSAGAIVVLDRTMDDPVEIVVDGKVIALGRLVVAQDNKLAVEICQVRRRVRAAAA